MGSAKGCVALAWRADLSPKTAEVIQQKLAHIKPGDILRADDGHFPMSEEDMNWQIDFMQEF